MIIYPAIDLIDGKCVRLYKGQFEHTKIYDVDPRDVAAEYRRSGAEWLHLVDLDGARNPGRRQIGMIQEIVSASGLKVQSGGGVRSIDDVQGLLNAGVSRVVVGSLAVREPDMVKDMFRTFGSDKICLAIDVVPDITGSYRVAVSGWTETSSAVLADIINLYKEDGLRHVLCTDISKDGTMAGGNVLLYDMMRYEFPFIEVMASGGVNSLGNLRELKEVGVSGAIIGKALYEGIFTVEEALSC